MMSRPALKQVEDALVVDAVVNARPFTPRLHEPDPPQRGEMLRRPARVELELALERADRSLSFAQHLEDPDARGMTEHAEEIRLHLMHGARVVRHLKNYILQSLKIQDNKSDLGARLPARPAWTL